MTLPGLLREEKVRKRAFEHVQSVRPSIAKRWQAASGESTLTCGRLASRKQTSPSGCSPGVASGARPTLGARLRFGPAAPAPPARHAPAGPLRGEKTLVLCCDRGRERREAPQPIRARPRGRACSGELLHWPRAHVWCVLARQGVAEPGPRRLDRPGCRMAEAAGVPYRTTGSTLLHPLSRLLGIPLDQVNFGACQLVGLLAAFWFRLYLSPNHASSGVRHAFAIIFGIYFAVFCFGWYSIHIFTLVMLSYGIMNMASIPNIHRYSFIVAMGYLTVCHASRIYIFHYGILTTDFSGPLMIVTQKITTLAFQVHDGIGRKAEDLSTEQNQLAIKIKPSLLEYLSYQLNFLSILVGPCSNYKDYIAFIEGRHVQMKLLEVNWKPKGHDKFPEPSPMGAVLHKLCIVLVSLLLFLTFTKSFPVSYIVDKQFIDQTSFLSRLGYLYVVMQASKPKYYFAWTLADMINNAAGYGFSGVDERGCYHWDLLSNLNIRNIEMATSFKMYVGNWNMQTTAWLKRVCYDRAPWYPTALTFLLSAVWHGVYPGYYFTFITGIFMTLAARAMRSNFRHFFTSSMPLKMSYDVATWLVTQLSVCYTVAPFVLLAVEPTIKLYRSLYFHMHILCFVVVLVLPKKPEGHRKRRMAIRDAQNSDINKKQQ